MKKLFTALILSILGVSTLATAAPRGPSWTPQRTLGTVEDFQTLKVGDTVAQVCKVCDSVSTAEIKSKEQAMQYCKDGAVLNCPSCKKKATVTVRGPRPENPRRTVTYVDEHGKACMFLAKVSEIGDTHKSIDRGPSTSHR
ncbi:MAG: hypothetical protein ACPGSB_01895 [Opitutales bacterium]